jgi:glutathione S-transferase
VVDHDGFRILETSAIAPYLDEVLPGPSFMPDNPKDRARMRMAIGIIDSYGYDALVGVAGYHLFPDFIGGKNEESRQQCMKTSKLVLQELMKVRSDDNFIAGERRSLADFHLAPICFYVALTPDAGEVFGEGLHALVGADAGPAELRVDRAAIGLTGLPPGLAGGFALFFLRHSESAAPALPVTLAGPHECRRWGTRCIRPAKATYACHVRLPPLYRRQVRHA